MGFTFSWCLERNGVFGDVGVEIGLGRTDVVEGFGPVEAIFFAGFAIGRDAALVERVGIEDEIFDVGAIGRVVAIAEDGELPLFGG